MWHLHLCRHQLHNELQTLAHSMKALQMIEIVNRAFFLLLGSVSYFRLYVARSSPFYCQIIDDDGPTLFLCELIQILKLFIQWHSNFFMCSVRVWRER